MLEVSYKIYLVSLENRDPFEVVFQSLVSYFSSARHVVDTKLVLMQTYFAVLNVFTQDKQTKVRGMYSCIK